LCGDRIAEPRAQRLTAQSPVAKGDHSQRVRNWASEPGRYEAYFYTARVVTGNMKLISGMVAANQHWRL